MKQIPLSRGKYAIVNDEDYEWLSALNWYIVPTGANSDRPRAATGYIKGGTNTRQLMHRMILERHGEQLGSLDVDHINGNTLDNRRGNLRACTHTQNMQNKRKRKATSSRYKGVSRRENGRWLANIRVDGTLLRLGLFDSEIDAAKTYDTAARQHFGEYARLNFAVS